MKEYEKWMRKAENDLLNIQNNLSSVRVPIDTCCFHAQQASEKYLKSYLVFKNKAFPKTHDLQSLILLCAESDPVFNELSGIAFTISDFGVEARYPDNRI